MKSRDMVMGKKMRLFSNSKIESFCVIASHPPKVEAWQSLPQPRLLRRSRLPKNLSAAPSELWKAGLFGGQGAPRNDSVCKQPKKMNQKGFTLMEILVVMAVGGMIMAAGLLTMYQVIWGTARTNDQVRALTDANVATMWLKFDLQMVQATPNLVEGVPSNTLSMTWTNLTTSFPVPPETEPVQVPVDHTIGYARDSTNNLWRTYDGTPKVVGRNITSVGFTRNGDYINVSLSAKGPGIIGQTRALAFSVYSKVRTE